MVLGGVFSLAACLRMRVHAATSTSAGDRRQRFVTHSFETVLRRDSLSRYYNWINNLGPRSLETCSQRQFITQLNKDPLVKKKGFRFGIRVVVSFSTGNMFFVILTAVVCLLLGIALTLCAEWYLFSQPSKPDRCGFLPASPGPIELPEVREFFMSRQSLKINIQQMQGLASYYIGQRTIF